MRRKPIVGLGLFFLALGLVVFLQPRFPTIAPATGHHSLNYLLSSELIASNAPVASEAINSPAIASAKVKKDPKKVPHSTLQLQASLKLEPSPLHLETLPFNFAESAQAAIARDDGQRFGSNSSEAHPSHETIDILWILVCSGLVFIMQAGFMCLESGLTRAKNSINVAVKNFTDFAISVAFFWAFGFALMFGRSLGGWIGGSGFFFTTEMDPFIAAFFLFQAMFCGTATTIVSGAVAERMKFSAYLIVASLVSGLIYPLYGHWAWNGAEAGDFAGWLGHLGFVDFAGSTVVHSVGGWVSLAALLVVGSRVGRFPPGGEPQKIHGSNLPISVLGTMLLWFGWFGFNGGSTLALNDRVATIIVNTVLSGVAGMITCLAIGWRTRQIPDVNLLINGGLAGLVAITAPCHAVNGLSAVIIGAVGGLVMMAVDSLLLRFRIDDAVGAVPVHLGAGVWGTLAVALFGQGELLGTNLNRFQQFGVQGLGVLAAFAVAFCLSYGFFSLVNRSFPLRVSAADEHVGLNVSEHRAKTEIQDLFRVMDSQAKTQDLSLRVPVEPFTEVGQIADRYNEVMDALEEAVTRTDAIVRTATEAIVTFTKPGLAITSANPSAENIFGRDRSLLVGMPIWEVVDFGVPSLPELPQPSAENTSIDFFSLEDRIINTHLFWVEDNNTGEKRLDMGVLPASAGDNAEEILENNKKIVFRLPLEASKEKKENNFSLDEIAAAEKPRDAIASQSGNNILNQDIIPDRQALFEAQIESQIESLTESQIESLTESLTESQIESQLQELVASGSPRELVGCRADGSRFPMEAAVTEAKLRDGSFYTGTFRDITHRKQAQAALQESEERFRAVMQQAADAFIIHDLEGRILDVNQSTCDTLGYTREELLKLSMPDIEVNFVSAEIQKQWQGLVGGMPITIEGVHRRKNETAFPVEVRVGLIEAGDRKLILALCRDVTERKRAEEALRSEREKSERLLLNILPEAIAEQLKENQETIAEGFAEVTVMFADIVGFTKLASRVSPTELVHLLNDIFSRFDLLAERHGLEKIKTIGDAYMVVGGLPVPRADSAEAIARMALDMQEEVASFSALRRESFSIRIGIHTGPVVAGVIGRKKFIYDLWGDTVNVASRMESQGIANEIQVTAETYALLQDKFSFNKRGVIRVKGKGDMTTYLLLDSRRK